MERRSVFLIGAIAAGCAGPPNHDDDATVHASPADGGSAIDGAAPDGAPTDSAAPDGAQTDGGVAGDAPAVCGFDVPASVWTLPPGASPGGYGGFEGVNAIGRFRAVDLDGDRWTDLVESSRFDDAGVGTARWLVHPGGADGFAADAVEWPLPATGGPFLIASDQGQFPAYDLLDLDGDSRPELVVTYRGEGAPVGNQHWEVYRNEGNGFAATSASWSLPSGYPPNAFRKARHAWFHQCPDRAGYELFDIDGDERPDLVVTDPCEGWPHTRWLVHRNNGTGFEDTPAPWRLPYPEHFELCEIPPYVTYAHVDLDGDRRPELVFTGSCTSEEVGVSRWIVNRNLGTSFAEAGESWPLPGGQPFHALHRRDEPSHTTSDVDGDGRADLVVLSRAGTELGTTRWAFHRNTGSGFAPAEEWCLPAGYGHGAFATTPHESCGTFPYQPSWALRDLDGDGRRELVVAHRCDGSNSAVGTDRWLVYRR